MILPVAFVVWVAAVLAVDPASMNDWGLFPALPIVFFVALGLLIASIALSLIDSNLSPVRLGLHLVALVLVLHGTVPMIFAEPNYPWAYKHIGVTSYVTLNGRLDPSIDLYHNWPGFFTLAAWFTKIAGVGSALAYAAWAPVYFNILFCLQLGFVFRWLPVGQRVRWLGLFLFVVGNWVGQDYFAPQALAFVLTLAVFGIVLASLQVHRPPAPVGMERRLARLVGSVRETIGRTSQRGPRPDGWSRTATLGALFGVYAMVVVAHQLSPFMVILGVGLLTAAGSVRPRWVVAAMTVMAVAYLLAHFSSLPHDDVFDLKHPGDLLGYLSDGFGNPDSASAGRAQPGRRVTALGAPALMLAMWGLGMLGVARRLRARRPTLVLAILAASPVLLFSVQNYGGEALFRIYLFSLPWTALLAASALEPGSRRRRRASGIRFGLALSVGATLFMSAFFGSEELYRVRAGEVRASQYFYDHATPGSLLALAVPSFPEKVGANYDRFVSPSPDLLITMTGLRHRKLDASDVPAVSRFVDQHATDKRAGRYLALSAGQRIYAEVLGLVPQGSLASLGRALDQSRDWRVFYRNRDATIYQSLPAPDDERGGTFGGRPVQPDRARGTLVGWLSVAVVLALFSVGLLILARKRWRRLALDHEPSVTDGGVLLDLLPDERSARDREAVDIATTDGGLGPAEPPAQAPEPQPAAVAIAASAEDLRSHLADPCGSVRAAALEVMEVSPEDSSLLQHMLRDDLCADVRVAAVRRLAEATEAVQLSALTQAMDDPDPDVRAAAADSLPVAGSARAAELLIASVDDPSHAVRRAVHLRLCAAPSWLLWMALQRCLRRDELCQTIEAQVPGRLDALIQDRLSSPEHDDRALAVELVRKVGTPDRLTETIDALKDPQAVVRRAAVGHLRGCLEAVPALINALKDPDASVRSGAVQALKGVAHDDALLALIETLHDPSADVQGEAIEALVFDPSLGLARRVAGVLTTTNAGTVGEVLLRLGAQGEEALAAAIVEGPSERAAAAVEVLRKAGHPNGLTIGLRSPDIATRQRTIEVLGRVGGAGVVDGLVSALSDPLRAIRRSALLHLGRLGDGGSREAVRRVCHTDQAPEVVQEARNALRMIDERARGAGEQGDRESPTAGW